jgi:WD40 repeat protein
LWFSRDGRRLLAFDENPAELVVYDLEPFRVTARMPLPGPPVNRATGTPIRRGWNDVCADDMAAPDTVAVTFGGMLSLFDLAAGRQVGPSLRPWRDANDLGRFSTTGACAARPGHDQFAFDAGRDVEIWEVARNSRLAALSIGSASSIVDMRFSPDGRYLAVAGVEGAVEVWDVDGRRRIGDPIPAMRPLSGLRIVDFDGARMILRNGEEIRVWDVARGAMLGEFDLVSSGARVSPDGSELLVQSFYGFVRIPLDPDAWAAHLCRLVGRDVTAAERGAMPPGSPTGGIC